MRGTGEGAGAGSSSSMRGTRGNSRVASAIPRFGEFSVLFMPWGSFSVFFVPSPCEYRYRYCSAHQVGCDADATVQRRPAAAAAAARRGLLAGGVRWRPARRLGLAGQEAARLRAPAAGLAVRHQGPGRARPARRPPGPEPRPLQRDRASVTPRAAEHPRRLVGAAAGRRCSHRAGIFRGPDGC